MGYYGQKLQRRREIGPLEARRIDAETAGDPVAWRNRSGEEGLGLRGAYLGADEDDLSARIHAMRGFGLRVNE